MDGRLIEIHRAYELTEAICARSFLDAHGIPVFLQNEHHITMSSGTLSLALGGYRFLVSASFAAEAKRLLNKAATGANALDETFDEATLSLWQASA